MVCSDRDFEMKDENLGVVSYGSGQITAVPQEGSEAREEYTVMLNAMEDS